MSEEHDKLMHSVLDNDQKKIDEGRVIADSINHGTSFQPDMIFERLVKNYSLAEQIYGERMLRIITGYSNNFLKKNITIPEFKKELKSKIQEKISDMKDENLLSKDGSITKKGFEFASLILYVDEINKINSKGFGRKESRQKAVYGAKDDIKKYSRATRYRDISIQKSLKKAIRRGHEDIIKDDLEAFERQSKASMNIIYALDASGSMKGKKLEECKKAAVALAFKAIEEKDKVGLLAFGAEIKEKVVPTNNFSDIINAIIRVRASEQTDIAKTITEATSIFKEHEAKHIILISDALPTKGKQPEKDTIEACSLARNKNITISVVGIGLDEQGKKLAEQIAQIGLGRFFVVRNINDIDRIVLEDYYAAKE